ncbi:BON domain-containing protein [Rhizobium sp. SSA_523]|uniref:BON domain-containing protein n=1 Tax=Rhizobium sp. SSA_523 TaxID=2952477 RepID=UPI0020902A70|nr:BON domain-containing protein [Rhizobium sp. SSA_523]MCO5731748.1 BON domain-containing protein [Rhizobium sp. SSA_523]WKC22881.1 BON domain-containing protein [Rhizobium sp. SSA_523]
MVFKPQTFHGEEPVSAQDDPPDAVIETSVAAALADDRSLDATDVRVVAKGSVVTLQGTVLSPGEIVRAEEVALSVAGVSATVNELQARGT